MTQLYLYLNKATTILATGGWAATTAYPLPVWAPDIAFIGNTTLEPHNVRASTDGAIVGGLGQAPAVERMVQASKRAYRIDGPGGTNRNDMDTLYTVILHYRAVGELVR